MIYFNTNIYSIFANCIIMQHSFFSKYSRGKMRFQFAATRPVIRINCCNLQIKSQFRLVYACIPIGQRLRSEKKKFKGKTRSKNNESDIHRFGSFSTTYRLYFNHLQSNWSVSRSMPGQNESSDQKIIIFHSELKN
jgi:hypothetical protein